MNALSITSADNKLFKLWHSLNAAKGIERHSLAIVSGRRIVPELAARVGDGATLLLREGETESSAKPPHPSPLPAGGERVLRAAHLAPALFDALDEFGTHAPLLVVPTSRLVDFDDALAPAGLEILVASQDPPNLGAILRSAHAFGACRIVLLEECAHPFLPKVTRASAGANFRLTLARGPSIRALEDGAVALDMKGAPIDAFDWPRDCRLLLGEEGAGIPDGFKGPRVAIPIAAEADSLNVAVAAGIALAAYRRQHPI